MRTFDDIKKFREVRGLSQKQLADLCGVTLRTVQNWESGKTIPENIQKLLRVIDGAGEIVSHSPSVNNENGNGINSSVNQQIKGNVNNYSGSGNVSGGVPVSLLKHALDEITAMRELLSESVHNANSLSQRMMSLLEQSAK